MQIRNRVVVRRRDGGLIKGYTFDFMPDKVTFHVVAPDDDEKITEVSASDLKAVFYVKTFEGNPGRIKSRQRAEHSLEGASGVKLRVSFQDGEVLYGTTTGYAPGRRGFFVTPAERDSNNERAYVFSDATTAVKSWR